MDSSMSQVAVGPTNVSIPDQKYAPKQEARPFYKQDVVNFADNEELVDKVNNSCRQYFEFFRTQAARVQFENDMDIADEMYRATKNRMGITSEQSRQTQDTFSQVSSTSFYRGIRARTSAEVSLIIGTEEMVPVNYEAVPDSGEYDDKQGIQLAKYQNALLRYTWDTGDFGMRVRQMLLYVNKYGNELCEMKWDYRKQKIPVRTPVKDADGNTTRFKWETKERIIADNPILLRHDMRNCWFDATIDDMQLQSCIVTRSQDQIANLWGLQRVGFKNVGKITPGLRSQGESGTNSNILTNREQNAGESADTGNMTDLFDVWRCWIRIPADPESGDWDSEKYVSTWWEAYFVGLLQGQTVCVMLRPNPYFCGKVPMLLWHSHEDDKGAFHMSYATLAKTLYMQECTVYDQAIDNVSLRNKKPWIAEKGSIMKQNKVFGPSGNMIIYKTPGSPDPHEIEVQDTTQQTLPMLQQLQASMREAMGTSEVFLGIAMGGRTSASEASLDYEQAMKPAVEEASFKASQLLPFIAYWNAEMWRQFGDPRRSITITHEGEQLEVKPSELWGPFNIRITSVKNFQDNILKRQEENQMLQMVYPLMQPLMSKQGQIDMFDGIATRRGFKSSNWWQEAKDKDAERVARAENDAILRSGVQDMPEEGENHAVHIPIHQDFLAQYKLLPKEDINENNVRLMERHIAATQSMQASAGASTPAGATGKMAPESATGLPETMNGLPGQMAQSMLGAAGGQVANSPAGEEIGGSQVMSSTELMGG